MRLQGKPDVGNHIEGESIGTSRFKRINLLFQFKGLLSPVSYHEWKSSRIRNWFKGSSVSFVSSYFKQQNGNSTFSNRDLQTEARKGSKKARIWLLSVSSVFLCKALQFFHSFSPSSFSCMHSNLTKHNSQTSQEDLAAVQIDNKT